MRRKHKIYAGLLVLGAAALVVDRAILGTDGQVSPVHAAALPNPEGPDPVSKVAQTLEALGSGASARAAGTSDVGPGAGVIDRVFSVARSGLGSLDPASLGSGSSGSQATPPALELTSVSLAATPMAVFRGTGPIRIGDEIAPGWRVTAIDTLGVTIAGQGQVHVYPLPGSMLAGASSGR